MLASLMTLAYLAMSVFISAANCCAISMGIARDPRWLPTAYPIACLDERLEMTFRDYSVTRRLDNSDRAATVIRLAYSGWMPAARITRLHFVDSAA